MKAERRHELKENELLHSLQSALKYLDEHGTRVGIAVIVVVVVIAVVAFGARSRSAAIEDIWRRKNQLTFDDPEVGRESLETLAAITREASDEKFVLTSLMDQGARALRLAKQVDFPPDRDLNEKAREAFEQLLDRFPGNPLAVGVARSGLATVEENAFVLDENPVHKERAEAHLSAIINDPAVNAMPFGRLAMDRREALDETFTTVTFDYSAREEAEAEPPIQPGIQFTPIFEPIEPVDEGLPVDPAEPVDDDLPVDRADPIDPADGTEDDTDGDASAEAETSGTPPPDKP